MEIVLIVTISAAAIAAVLYPLVTGSGTHPYTDRRRPPARLLDDAALEAEIARYRAALRAGSVCRACAFANPARSRYCADCGRAVEGVGSGVD